MRMFWNGPRPEPPSDPVGALAVSSPLPLLRSAKASNAAANCWLLLLLADAVWAPPVLPVVPDLLEALLPRSSESSFDFAPSLPGASWLASAPLVVPDPDPTKMSLRILATLV